MNENVELMTADEEENGEEGKRQRSTIAFPYSDFEAASNIATALHGNVGHGVCSLGQLAAWVGQSPKSSGFRVQLAAARLFGLIESDGPDSIRLGELGRRILDPLQQRAARAEAFLRVPLFKALYELHKDGVVPPTPALETEIASLGVSEKQKTRARQVFESSSQQTGFRDAAPNRLVMPAIVVPPPAKEKEVNPKPSNEGGGVGLALDPLLMALLRKIPEARIGQWPAENRLRWFRTFAMNVSQVYDDDASAVELDIQLKKDQQ